MKRRDETRRNPALDAIKEIVRTGGWSRSAWEVPKPPPPTPPPEPSLSVWALKQDGRHFIVRAHDHEEALHKLQLQLA